MNRREVKIFNRGLAIGLFDRKHSMAEIATVDDCDSPVQPSIDGFDNTSSSRRRPQRNSPAGHFALAQLPIDSFAALLSETTSLLLQN